MTLTKVCIIDCDCSYYTTDPFKDYIINDGEEAEEETEGDMYRHILHNRCCCPMMRHFGKTFSSMSGLIEKLQKKTSKIVEMCLYGQWLSR